MLRYLLIITSTTVFQGEMEFDSISEFVKSQAGTLKIYKLNLLACKLGLVLLFRSSNFKVSKK